jgi:ribosome-associated toxin RatA of RatAB toxin-antitoxin module
VVVAVIRFRYHAVGFDFTTRNPKQRPHAMRITQERGPFRRFEGDWRLAELAPDACRIDFTLACEFANPLLGKVAGPIFEKMAGRMVDVFVARADAMQAAAPPPPAPSVAPDIAPSAQPDGPAPG